MSKSGFSKAPKPKSEADFVGNAPSVAMPEADRGQSYIRVNMQLTMTQHETLRRIAFDRRVSMAEIMREAVDGWLAKQ